MITLDMICIKQIMICFFVFGVRGLLFLVLNIHYWFNWKMEYFEDFLRLIFINKNEKF